MAHNFAPPAAPMVRLDVTDVDGTGDMLAELSIPMDASRKDLLIQAADLEGCLQYMGAGHPQREATRARLEALQALLSRWDSTAAAQGR